MNFLLTMNYIVKTITGVRPWRDTLISLFPVFDEYFTLVFSQYALLRWNFRIWETKAVLMHQFDLLHNTHEKLHHFIKIHTNNSWNAENIMVNMYLHTLIFMYCFYHVYLIYLTDIWKFYNLIITHTASTLNICHMIYSPFALFIVLQILKLANIQLLHCHTLYISHSCSCLECFSSRSSAKGIVVSSIILCLDGLEVLPPPPHIYFYHIWTPDTLFYISNLLSKLICSAKHIS